VCPKTQIQLIKSKVSATPVLADKYNGSLANCLLTKIMSPNRIRGHMHRDLDQHSKVE
jgi:hypothetical protein